MRGALAVLVALALSGAGCSPERFWNRVDAGAPTAVAEEARALHAASLIVDLHADPLLWGRDLSSRSSVGQVDLPRLRAGNVALQIFTMVTHVPILLSISRTDERWPDAITLLAFVSGWPAGTLWSRLERALFQARRLEHLAARDGRVIQILTAADVDRLLERRRDDPRVLGALLGIEGAHALDGDPGNLERLHDVGLRLVGLVHFFDNDFAGSAHGRAKGGLTERGRELLVEMARLGTIVDLAHSSAQTIDDVLAVWPHPPLVSHTGVKGTCDNPRNLSDDQVRAIAAAGGVIGIGYWDTAVCGNDAAAIAKAIRYTVELVGDRHVALGSDFDGAVTTPFDSSGLAQVTGALLDAGLAPESIRRILGENALRVLRQSLPAS